MNQAYQSCIELCLRCASAYDNCAASCLKEENVQHMTRCIQLDMECAAICRVAAQFMSLDSDHANAICQLCSDICHVCAEECNKHEMEHCKACAEICYQCAEECASMAAA